MTRKNSFWIPRLRGLLIMLVLLAGVQVRAAEVDPAAEALEGTWLVSVTGESRERFMVLSGAKSERGEVKLDRAEYGWLDGRPGNIKDWSALVRGNAIELRFLTPADSVVTARIGVEDTTVSGRIVYTSGRDLELRMTRLPPEELAALREQAREQKAGTKKAAKAKAVPHAGAQSTIHLVYVGSADCPSCRGYEAEYFGRKDLMTQVVPDFAKIRYVKSSLSTYRARDPVGRVPPELAWLAERGANGKYPLARRGVPFFALVVDDKVWAQGHGTTALETLIAPEIRRAVAERGG